ncbi:hypothetical protein I6F21_34910 [Bradyrhizobium sp. NBAIM03]|uniref:hypothetical protein n=1 Tax=Bradyrhizobium sp. NBAIM03 TaxID=2793816 RepID=UPI001CD3EC92|nr:hypothetical protein [Bradyrhizobium sp. NBAIM03]MCA1537707.1 hypothetical protein [Bradyrhizobium sp. NBAIM03]
MMVARSEGVDSFSGDGGTSFGSYQVHVTPGGRGKAVGDQFRAATGLDPSDPANERATIRFALDDVKAHGWSAYHGARRVGISDWRGIERGGGSTSTTEVNITGPITINAGSNADGTKVAQEFRAELRRRQSEAALANSGAQ